MPSKKELMARITELEDRLLKLENMHANVTLGRNWKRLFEISRGAAWETNDGRVGFYGDRQLTAREVQFQTRHPHPKQVDYRCLTNVPTSTAETERISKVTFEELARLVIDGTPIRREEKITSKRISEYTEDTTTRITIPE